MNEKRVNFSQTAFVAMRAWSKKKQDFRLLLYLVGRAEGEEAWRGYDDVMNARLKLRKKKKKGSA